MPLIGFIVTLGVVLVVFYLFIKKIFSENKIVDDKDKGKVLPIDIDEKIKKDVNKDKGGLEGDKKDTKQQEISTKKGENDNNTEHI